MTKDLTYYAKRFVKLRVDRAKGVAPHKPILLLAVLDLLGKEQIHRNEIYLSPELTANFLKFWHRFVASDHHSNIALPFFHLTGDNFWHLMPNPGFEAAIAARVKFRTLPVLRAAVKYAYLDGELFALLQTPQTRTELTTILIQAWFPEKAGEIAESFTYDEFEAVQQSLLDSGGATYNVEDLKDQDQIFVRNAAFRRNVVKLYDQRCAFCKLRVVSWDGANIVDGAHIQPFAEFRDDRFVNGLALCKNHHWAFDRGWFGVDDDYRIVIPWARFKEEAAVGSRGMMQFRGERIELPREERFMPSLEGLRWHRERWEIG
ncbi:HNH endonuclease [Nodosilinea sp. P-1105]|uniref:HNH endonuclease n=1 Tax=Nodosilinea sp. P-1105 TaxID=2546229 RepID=UPI00146DE79E|nr:HNH endonuclease [Nodosilinea sp. P-1105]NMF85698.1 HNH endonuclease [Nodosilinea sp. P-1105]